MKEPNWGAFENFKILHVGCGTGSFTASLAGLGAKSVLGIDTSYKCIQSPPKLVDINGDEEIAKKMTLKNGRIEKIIFENKSLKNKDLYDLVCVSEMNDVKDKR